MSRMQQDVVLPDIQNVDLAASDLYGKILPMFDAAHQIRGLTEYCRDHRGLQ